MKICATDSLSDCELEFKVVQGQFLDSKCPCYRVTCYVYEIN